jgi:hypothetical protein
MARGRAPTATSSNPPRALPAAARQQSIRGRLSFMNRNPRSPCSKSLSLRSLCPADPLRSVLDLFWDVLGFIAIMILLCGCVSSLIE